MNTNFIKVENSRGKIIGVIAVEKGSEEEVMLIDSFLDQELPFMKATESEYVTFDADVIKRAGRAIFCHLLPEE